MKGKIIQNVIVAVNADRIQQYVTLLNLVSKGFSLTKISHSLSLKLCDDLPNLFFEYWFIIKITVPSQINVIVNSPLQE